MRFARVVPFIPLASALVITEAEVFEKLPKSNRHTESAKLSGKELLDNARDILDSTYYRVKDSAQDIYTRLHDATADVESWLEGSSFDDATINFGGDDHRPHHPPHDGPPHYGPPHHGGPHDGDDKPNRTVYELINESKYTTRLAELINKYDDLVETLNSTKANYTIFAPTDEAFEKIPNHGRHPSKEVLKDILLYHVSPDFYPGGRVLHSYTIPTLFEPEKLGHKQRLTVRVTLKGPTINFYSKLVAVNIFGTNGVVHGVDSILVPPPKTAKILELLPGEFSTLELALHKTGLFNNTDYPHSGGTFFAPSNFAFKKLGPRVNAFLFSSYGQKYLKALLKYHIVVNQTLYTDAFFDSSKKHDDDDKAAGRPGNYHYDLPTVLDDKYLAVDVARYGPFVEIRINAFSRVTVHDGIASDAVIQVVSDVLIPPKSSNGEQVMWQGEELSVEEFKERLAPLAENIEL
ncbi:FAS1 domain-containing protein [Didymella exigua CBS 183.55]|uniref:FAS1 domain-containing protein n=1 Tax=Didymella exigua CBS 183.55 TaxID=1150837 RepID=A0A6A5RQE9_9PLEO|nr:FAS1 domain-containing protein [Didymella exigua CBS 183.55]KAF1929274.1 FAS1 domain-containing protein [Didymella exigua CBS 183.55]